jgi:predicted metalloprotease with PDZ domain
LYAPSDYADVSFGAISAIFAGKQSPVKYIVSCPQPSSHLIDIHFIIENNACDLLRVQLPAWRPGRYELGNFAKNIQRWEALDSKGKKLQAHKVTKDCWEIQTEGNTEIHIKYNYYAAQLDAGACWLDEKQLYINGVHCFLYVHDRIQEPCHLHLLLPESYEVATGLEKKGLHVFHADSFHTLVDCPLIAGASLQHNSYMVEGTAFHIWFQGECRPNWERILPDFSAFTREQLLTMGDFPFSEYHYLIQVLPTRFYHGVEHYNSTVIAIGPGYSLMKKEVYQDFTGVNSHELFHAWNIKSIRPAEMQPYDYTRENYSRLGYVAEGVTTYYGDLFLVRSGVYTEEQYFSELNQRLQRHFDNYARFTMPVAEASFDTWLDGYVPGIPDRKTSIYDEGCLCALMVDLLIRRHTGSARSLDDVMRTLYTDFGKKQRGYTEQEYRKIVNDTAGASLDSVFDNYIYGVSDYRPLLEEVLSFAGCVLEKSPAKTVTENFFGFRHAQEGNVTKVIAVAPGSAASVAGLSKDDEIIGINGCKVENNLNDWCSYFLEDEITLEAVSTKKIRKISLRKGDSTWYPRYSVIRVTAPDAEQQEFFSNWLKGKG